MSWLFAIGDYFNLLIIAGVAAALVGLRFLRPNMLVWSLAWLVAMVLFFRYGFATPVPTSVVQLYTGIVLLAIFAYVTSSPERREATFGPIERLAVEPRYTVPLVLLLVAIPAAAAFSVYRGIHRPLEAPVFGRTVHPASPNSIVVHGETIELSTADNPLRHLETDDPEAFRRHVANGRDTYYRNCHYCHGDNMTGNGMFAHGLYPIPTNFSDQGTIPMFQESYLFWRVAKGAPGLPDEGGPWDSAMPAWEQFLGEEEMWEVILFLYDYTGTRPRARVEHHE